MPFLSLNLNTISLANLSISLSSWWLSLTSSPASGFGEDREQAPESLRNEILIRDHRASDESTERKKI